MEELYVPYEYPTDSVDLHAVYRNSTSCLRSDLVGACSTRYDSARTHNTRYHGARAHSARARDRSS